MRSKGKLLQVFRNFQTRTWLLTVEISESPEELFQRVKEKDCSVEIKEWREKRGLNANAYYWVLTGKTAEALGISTNELHNINLRACGYIETMEGKPVYLVIPETDEAEKKVNNYEHLHLRPTSQTKEGTDGRIYRTYILLRGSHTFDKKEFSRLLDVAIEHGKEAGVETMTPDQLERIKETIKYEST